MAVNNRLRALERQMKSKRIVREPEACSRLGCRRTKFRTDHRFNNTADPFVPGTEIPRVRPVPLGPRNVAYLDAELDDLIDAIAKLRDDLPVGTRAPLNGVSRK
jgi:predicted DNA-binding transcriptional regulator AlpA